MKTLLLTFSMVLAAIALQAQSGPITVNNNSGVEITVRMSVNSSTCVITTGGSVTIADGDFAVIQPLFNDPTYIWSRINAAEVGGTSFSSTPNRCLINCLTTAPINNGLTTVWDPMTGCFEIEVL